jgi:UDP-galactopyranose mutase
MTEKQSRILVAGAGFAGAVAARLMAEAGFFVDVIDKRPHIGGNAFDRVNAHGVRVHAYGPHLFHTNNTKVVEWLSAFTSWVPYEHRVTALLPGGDLVPLPINRRTLEAVFREPLADEAAVAALLQRAGTQIAHPANAEEYLLARLGPELTELFFARYTRKMWGMSLSELDASVVQRIPIRTDDEDRYFPGDSFQALPANGYTALFERMLAHDNIHVGLSVAFDKTMLARYRHAFLSLPIDEYYDFRLGELPYRSIRFHHEDVSAATVRARTATVNFTDTSGFTRKTYWHLLPAHWVTRGATVTCTTEEPCDYKDNDFERYYPVKTADGRYQALSKAYSDHAAQEDGVTFIGRCGTYQYLDMHQVVNQTMAIVRRWLADRGYAPDRGFGGSGIAERQGLQA